MHPACLVLVEMVQPRAEADSTLCRRCWRRRNYDMVLEGTVEGIVATHNKKLQLTSRNQHERLFRFWFLPKYSLSGDLQDQLRDRLRTKQQPLE